jgi:hypothetical protein
VSARCPEAAFLEIGADVFDAHVAHLQRSARSATAGLGALEFVEHFQASALADLLEEPLFQREGRRFEARIS